MMKYPEKRHGEQDLQRDAQEDIIHKMSVCFIMDLRRALYILCFGRIYMKSKMKRVSTMSKLTLINVYETKDKMNQEKIKKLLIQYIRKQIT